jgi:hypothetical protein
MTLTLHHKLALLGATAASCVALFDAMTHGLTGHPSVFGDETAPMWAQTVSLAVHGLAYVALGVVLVHEGRRIDAASRVARAARWATVGAFAVLATVFLVGMPLGQTLDQQGVDAVVGAAAGAGFLSMFLGGLTLGISLWRVPGFGLESRLLASLPAAFALVVMLGWQAPAWAHPAYLETLLHFGVAFTGAGVAVRAERRTAVPHEAF